MFILGSLYTFAHHFRIKNREIWHIPIKAVLITQFTCRRSLVSREHLWKTKHTTMTQTNPLHLNFTLTCRKCQYKIRA